MMVLHQWILIACKTDAHNMINHLVQMSNAGFVAKWATWQEIVVISNTAITTLDPQLGTIKVHTEAIREVDFLPQAEVDSNQGLVEAMQVAECILQT